MEQSPPKESFALHPATRAHAAIDSWRDFIPEQNVSI